jgi:hypothetical protein
MKKWIMRVMIDGLALLVVVSLGALLWLLWLWRTDPNVAVALGH